jgi:hypothetical protein
MPRYAKIKDNEVINELQTLTTIPQDDWTIKNILPLININERYIEGTKPERENGYYILKDKVEKVNNSFYREPTLEELKEQKLKELDNYILPTFPELYKQINSLFGIYDKTKSDEIKNQVIEQRNKYHQLKDEIENSLTTDNIEQVRFEDANKKDKQDISE